MVDTVVGGYTIAKNLTGNQLYNVLGPTLGNQFEFTRESHENVNKALTSMADSVGNFLSHPIDGTGKLIDAGVSYVGDFTNSVTTVATTDRNSERLFAAKDATVQVVDTVLLATGIYDGIKAASTIGKLARNAVGDVSVTLRNPGLDLVDNWKIADELPSRGTLVRNEQGNYTLKMQGEAAQGTGGFKQLSAPAETPRLTFDAKTGAEITPVGAPLRLESNVGTAAPSPASFTESVKGPFSVAIKEERIVMPGEFASHASSTGLGKVFTKPLDEIYTDVYAVPKASRPPVDTYMSKPAIDAHVAQFDDGASRFMTQSNLSKYGPAQADGTAFVMTRKQADKLLADAGGDAAKFEQALGLPANTLSTNPMVRVDFPRPRELNVRVPRGTEAGANSQWMPGGYLPSGQLEAVLDLGAAKPGAYTTTPVVPGAPVIPANPTAYSVAFETKLNKTDFGKSRDVHFNRANAALDKALKSDAEFARTMETLIPGVHSSVSSVGGRATPKGWTWEHASTSTASGQQGVMRLVPTSQHTPGSPFWRVLHPDQGARGGYSEWAIPNGAPKN